MYRPIIIILIEPDLDFGTEAVKKHLSWLDFGGFALEADSTGNRSMSHWTQSQRNNIFL